MPPSSNHREFNRKDLAEVALGACVLVLPLALTEEAWTVGADVPLVNVLLFALVSYAVIGFFVYYRMYGGDTTGHEREFRRRVFAIYAVNIAVAAVCLLGIEKLPVLPDPIPEAHRAGVGARELPGHGGGRDGLTTPRGAI